MGLPRLLSFAISASLAATPLLRAQAAPQDPAPDTTAPISVLVFTDYECPYSAALFHNLETLEHRYPNLHVTWKASPLPIHPGAPLAHRAALAAGRQGKFQQMSELLYANQTRQDRPALLNYAAQLHLDLLRFRRDLDSPAITAELAADEEESRAIGVDQTPVLFVNGKELTGVQSPQVLTALFDHTAPPAPLARPAATTRLDPALTAELEANPSASSGSSTAPLTIVEFTDFQCPFCRASVAPMEQFMAARGREVRWIFRSFPLDFHPDSELANEAALAAGEQGKFWEMHDLLFAHQNALKAPDLRAYAELLHLDMKSFDQAMTTHRFAGQIAADRVLGLRAGVTGTPTFIIDGQLMAGARSVPELNQIADAHAAAAKSGPQSTLLASTTVVPPTLPDQQILGPPSAPLTLAWYTDVRSPLATRQAELLHRLATRYNGRIRILFRALPLETHPDARLASAALLAALQQGKFWEMYALIADRRDQLSRDQLFQIAAGLSLDPTAFDSALNTSLADVAQDSADAARRGILGAPVLFINDQRVDGLQRDQFYTDLIDQQLKSAPPPTQASLQPK